MLDFPKKDQAMSKLFNKKISSAVPWSQEKLMQNQTENMDINLLFPPPSTDSNKISLSETSLFNSSQTSTLPNAFWNSNTKSTCYKNSKKKTKVDLKSNYPSKTVESIINDILKPEENFSYIIMKPYFQLV